MNGASDTPSDQQRERLTVRDAAARLGISTESVRQRINRGTLPSERRDGRVYVLFDAAAEPSDPPSDAGSNGRSDNQSDDEQTTAARCIAPEHHADLVATLRAQVEHLQQELGIRTDELSRKDRLLLEALSVRAALPAVVESCPASAPARPWWQRLWERPTPRAEQG